MDAALELKPWRLGLWRGTIQFRCNKRGPQGNLCPFDTTDKPVIETHLLERHIIQRPSESPALDQRPSVIVDTQGRPMMLNS